MPEVRMDEFAFVLLAGVILIVILMVTWTTPPELPPSVKPKTVRLSVQRGASTTFSLTINGTLTAVNLTGRGEIKDWLSFNKNNFDVSNTEVVTVSVKVPEEIELGTYSGRIDVESLGGKETVSVSLEVLEIVEELKKRPISLGDFSVRYTAESEMLDSKESVEAVNGYFTGKEINLVGVLTEEKLSIAKEGYIRLILEETNSAGNLIVVFNGEKVYDRKAKLGEILIPIDKEMIEKSNTVRIKAGLPGFMFWMNTVYKFRRVELSVDYEILPKEFTFSLSQRETTNFRDFRLFYRVRDYSTPLPEMMIKINDQIVFWERPPLAFFDRIIEEDMFENALYLKEGNNTISFSFEQEASYEIADATLTVEYY